MKILKIRIRNMHSLKDDHLIDFTSGVLSDAGLFVITGPTGAGKSTILDAITLALFNRIPRLNQKEITSTIIEEEGIIITKNAKDCLAEVEYEVKGKKYLSSWTINRNRNNKLNERKQELIDLDTGAILVSGKKEVVNENVRIIGLSYEQFIQSLVLAQGQFAKLLLSKKDERNQLLEDITGASIYRKIGKEVFFKFSKAGKAVELHKAKMEGIELLSDEDLEIVQLELKGILPILEEKKDIKTGIDQKIKIKNDIHSIGEKLKILETEFSQFTAIKKEHYKDENKLNEHIKFVVFKESLNRLDSGRSKIQALIEKKDKLLADLENSKTRKKKILLEANEMTKQNLDSSTFEKSLIAFQSKITILLNAEIEKKGELRQESIRIADKLNELLKFNLTLRLEVDLAPTVENLILQIEEEIKEKGLETIEDIRNRKDQLNEYILPAIQVIGDGKLYFEKKQNLESLMKSSLEKSAQLEEWKETKKKIREQIENSTPIVKNLKIELDVFSKMKNLEMHRQELEEGEPCPLCGSLEHPFAKTNSEFHLPVIQQKYDEQNKLLEEWTIQNLKVESSIEKAQENLVEIQATIESRERDANILFEKLKVNCSILNWNPEDSFRIWETLLASWQKEIRELDALSKSLEAKTTLIELQHLSANHHLLQEEFQLAQNKRIALFPGSDPQQDIAKLLQKFQANQLETKSINNSILEIYVESDKEISEVKSVEEKLLSEIKLLGIGTVEELKSKILSESQAESIRNSVRILREREVSMQTTKKILDKSLLDAKKADNIETTFDVLIESSNQLELDIENTQRQIGSLKEKINKDIENRIRNKTAREELIGLQNELDLWSKMNAMIGDATGKKFSNFVQDLTLEQLIHYGNKRLIGFSDRYLLDTPNSNESEALKVIDTFMGNTRRAVSSLSGGETFKLSLALAFGLSDLAAKNVEIESLFIDEGFGSLDPESLDQSITILENMQFHSNKSIGIISHVNELKDRISTKIKLVQTGSGFSTIEIE